MRIPSKPFLPPFRTAAGLFITGSTIGPMVDSLHNQCLLQYDIAPISIGPPNWEAAQSLASSARPIFCSSWAVPPLLGIAYVILGYILPRIFEIFGDKFVSNRVGYDDENMPGAEDSNGRRNFAILAVTSTALIIKLSEYLETHNNLVLNSSVLTLDTSTKLAIMTAADVLQWIALDQTPVALAAATITAYGGPVSELPFVANGFWHYIPEAANYLPLKSEFFQSGSFPDILAISLLGSDYQDLALSSITGPCYFAVTMDAIALGRYFYSLEKLDK
ncbi:hypothetical protein ACHAXS_006852 [Conticribra weissflogii]